MIKNMICIECPKGCPLDIDMEGNTVVKVSGHKCPRGEKYAISEVENPKRILTASVLTEGLPIRMAPVRTSLPIPKPLLFKAMDEIKRMRIRKPLKAGEVVEADFLKTGADLIVTREIPG